MRGEKLVGIRSYLSVAETLEGNFQQQLNKISVYRWHSYGYFLENMLGFVRKKRGWKLSIYGVCALGFAEVQESQVAAVSMKFSSKIVVRIHKKGKTMAGGTARQGLKNVPVTPLSVGQESYVHS